MSFGLLLLRKSRFRCGQLFLVTDPLEYITLLLFALFEPDVLVAVVVLGTAILLLCKRVILLLFEHLHHRRDHAGVNHRVV